MKSRIHRRLGDFRVVTRRSRDVDEIQIRGFLGEKALMIRIDPGLRKRLPRKGTSGLANVGHGHDPDILFFFRTLQVRGNMTFTRDKAVPNDRSMERFGMHTRAEFSTPRGINSQEISEKITSNS
jgi:hypothetical protein